MSDALKKYIYKLFFLMISWLILLLARVDSGAAWIILWWGIISTLILIEFFYIRRTVARIFATAIARNKFLAFLIEGKVINWIFSIVISFYFGFHLVVFINMVEPIRIISGFFIGGLLFVIFYEPVKESIGNSNSLQERPSRVAGRVAIIVAISILMMSIDATYEAFKPIDPRIQVPADINIPLYVMNDFSHSFEYLQHYIRTLLYINYVVDSLELLDGFGKWFFIVKFFIVVSPTPYIAYILILLALESIKIQIKQEGDIE